MSKGALTLIRKTKLLNDLLTISESIMKEFKIKR